MWVSCQCILNVDVSSVMQFLNFWTDRGCRTFCFQLDHNEANYRGIAISAGNDEFPLFSQVWVRLLKLPSLVRLELHLGLVFLVFGRNYRVIAVLNVFLWRHCYLGKFRLNSIKNFRCRKHDFQEMIVIQTTLAHSSKL